MPSLAKLLFCLLFIGLCQTEARESKFFAKYVHLSKSTNNNYVAVPGTVPEQDVSLPSSSPAPAPVTSQISDVPASSPLVADYVPAPAPDQAPLEPSFGYPPAPLESEMYAKGTGDFTSAETTVVDNEEEEFSDEEFSIETPGKRESNIYSNGYSNSLSNNNGFWTSNHKGYNTNGYYYKSDQPQGMSDTRFVNNGEFYDNNVEPENDGPKGYGSVRQNKNEEGDYYGNNDKSKYEFDSMEEYERKEGYPDVEQQFIP